MPRDTNYNDIEQKFDKDLEKLKRISDGNSGIIVFEQTKQKLLVNLNKMLRYHLTFGEDLKPEHKILMKVKADSEAGHSICKSLIVNIEKNKIKNLKKTTYKCKFEKNKNIKEESRNKFNTYKRSAFLQNLIKNHEKELRKAFKEDGFSDKKKLGVSMTEIDEQIAKMKDGQVPDGYTVHHKRPLAFDYGKNLNDTINSEENFVLIGNTEHAIIHYLTDNSVIKTIDGKVKNDLEYFSVPENCFFYSQLGNNIINDNKNKTNIKIKMKKRSSNFSPKKIKKYTLKRKDSSNDRDY